MYHGEGIAFDPEGVLGTLPSIVNVIAGYLAGSFVRQAAPARLRSALYRETTIAGVICVAVALCWNEVFPINKKLWTSSYVMLGIGLDLLLLALLMFVIDVRQMTGWTYFFEVFGKNTLFIYLVSEVLVIIAFAVRIGGGNLYQWLYQHWFTGWAPARGLAAVCRQLHAAVLADRLRHGQAQDLYQGLGIQFQPIACRQRGQQQHQGGDGGGIPQAGRAARYPDTATRSAAGAARPPVAATGRARCGEQGIGAGRHKHHRPGAPAPRTSMTI